jgi:GTP-binding protein
MKPINAVSFVKGINGSDAILHNGIPQIAFVGRSNVGKSSVINSLLNGKDVAKTGKKPGKTTEINFFSINNDQLYFVDTPGYGYARLGPKQREHIRRLIIWYLTSGEATPTCVVIILDAQVGMTEFDKDVLDMLRECGHPYVIVANKIDRLNQKESSKQRALIAGDSHEADIISYSAKNGTGTAELLARLWGQE